MHRIAARFDRQFKLAPLKRKLESPADFCYLALRQNWMKRTRGSSSAERCPGGGQKDDGAASGHCKPSGLVALPQIGGVIFPGAKAFESYAECGSWLMKPMPVNWRPCKRWAEFPGPLPLPQVLRKGHRKVLSISSIFPWQPWHRLLCFGDGHL